MLLFFSLSENEIPARFGTLALPFDTQRLNYSTMAHGMVLNHEERAGVQREWKGCSRLSPEKDIFLSKESHGDVETSVSPNCAGLGEVTGTHGKPLGGVAWLACVERLCAALGASIVRRLVTGPPQTSEENAGARWLRHPLLLNAEVTLEHQKLGGWESTLAASDAITARSTGADAKGDGSDIPQGEEERHAGSSSCSSFFVEQLCRRPESREPRALASAMRRVVLEDRGGDQDTNEAVWAVAAAVVHHAGLAAEAAQVVRAELEGRTFSPAKTSQGSRENVPFEVSPTLVRAWKSAQRARFWLGGEDSPDLDKPLLVQRASFLLFLKPWALTHAEESSLESDCDGGVGVDRTLTATELVLGFLLRPTGTGSPQRRSGREGDAIKDNDAERRYEALEGDPGALLRVVELWSVRAMARARGFSLADRLLVGKGSERSTTAILRAVGDGLATVCLGPESADCKHEQATDGVESVSSVESRRGDTSFVLAQLEGGDGDVWSCGKRLHFMSGVECCDARSKLKLAEAVARFLRRCSAVLRHFDVGNSDAAGVDGKRRAVLVHTLSAVSMDYGLEDHGILHGSRLLPLISGLVDDVDRPIAAAASDALQALYRCVVLSKNSVGAGVRTREQLVAGEGCGHTRDAGGKGGDGLQREEENESLGRRGSNTPFQRAFFGAVRHKVQDIAEASWKKRLAAVGTMPDNVSSAPSTHRVLLEDLLVLRSDQAGMVVPHFSLGTRHSISLWVFFPPMTVATAAPCDEALGDSEDAAIAAASAKQPSGSYVVVAGVRCVVRGTPSLTSDEVGVLDPGEVIEVASPEPQFARHPSVLQGRRVYLTRPVKGYVSLYTEDGTVLLGPISGPSRRRASEGDLGGSVGRVGAVCLAGDSSGTAEGGGDWCGECLI